VQTILGQGGFHNVYGPADLLYCTALTFRPLAATGPSSPVIIDQLQDLDPARIDCFRQQMGTIAWHLDQPQLWPRICGIFDEGQLVATGAIRLWGDAIGEIFVDTLPTYRNLGYAKALAGRLTEWLLRETNWIPQYDAEVENIHSLRIAHRLGFQRYGVMLVASEV
jgi:GNAT superfamily N-acetyltransferase